ncbi:hypothetical protein Tco_0716025 [Tanacetum coccineum]
MLVVAIGLQVVAPNDIFTPTSAVRMRGGSEAGSSSNRLRTISGKKVIMRRKGDGSRAYMYPNGRFPIGQLELHQKTVGSMLCYKNQCWNHWSEEMHNIKGGWLLKGEDNKCSKTSSTRTSVAEPVH